MAVRPVPLGAGAARACPRALALAIVTLAALVAPWASSAAPGTSVEVELAQTRERLEQVSVELAALRADDSVSGAAEGAEIARLERRLQLRKDRLVERERILRGLSAREGDQVRRDAERRGRQAGEAPAPDAATAPSAPAPSAPVARATPAAPAASTVAPLPLTGDTAQRIDAYLASKASPLTGLGAVFVREAGRVGMDPRFLVAIAGSETSFGTYGPAIEIHNPFGLGPHIPYPSWDAAIAAAATTLSGSFYVGEGRFTIAAIQQRWAPNGATNDPTGLNSNWTRNVSLYFAEQGGDPAAPVFSAEVMAGRAPAPLPAGAGLAWTTGVAQVAPRVGASEAGPEAAKVAAGFLGQPTRAASADGIGPAVLVRRAYREAGLQVDGGPAALARLGSPVRPSELRAGDVLVFDAPGVPVATLGVYLGDGAFVHAPADAPQVTLASLYQPRFTQSYAGARRF
jgi:cell wall-associated NlpC family hydrolase